MDRVTQCHLETFPLFQGLLLPGQFVLWVTSIIQSLANEQDDITHIPQYVNNLIIYSTLGLLK